MFNVYNFCIYYILTFYYLLFLLLRKICEVLVITPCSISSPNTISFGFKIVILKSIANIDFWISDIVYSDAFSIIQNENVHYRNISDNHQVASDVVYSNLGYMKKVGFSWHCLCTCLLPTKMMIYLIRGLYYSVQKGIEFYLYR